MHPENYYQLRLEKFTSEEKKIKKEVSYLSLFRLGSMIIFIYMAIKAIKENSLLFIVFSAIFLVLFFVFVIIHKRKNDEHKKKQILKKINKQELNALKGDYHQFKDGANFLNPDHEFTYDLDIFGPSSLFQFLCRCCTLSGEDILASRLINSPLKTDKITEYQEIHRELSKDPDFMQEYLATGKTIEEKPGEVQQIKTWLDKSETGIRKWSHLVASLLATINTGLLILTIALEGWGNILIVSIIVSWFFYGNFISAINRYHSEFGKKQDIIKKYNVLSRILGRSNFEHKFLQNGAEKSQEGLRKIRKLEKLMDIFDSRLNMLVGVILNTLFMADFQIILLLEKWKKNNSELLKDLLNIHAETDALISGGIYQFNHPSFVNPEINTGEFSAQKIGHPLIQPGFCVMNDFKLKPDEKIIIITGANMAGKSTFLRTLGVNFILAGAGLPVYAEEFRFMTGPIITGMRTTDSLTESESYFFAELKRMKKIMDRLRSGERLIVLLDEILKGTNSVDKHKGSEELLKQMLEHDCIVFIATHDLELSKLENIYPDSIKNYHFESKIEGGELKFDYKIKEGKAENMNASFLLRKMGVLK